MKKNLIFALAIFLLPVAVLRAQTQPSDPVEQRANQLLEQLTLTEKLHILGGTKDFFTIAVPRLGIPSLKMSDGPVGTRTFGPSTAFPAGACLAATWDVDLAAREGLCLGRDARARGDNILLGPGLNIYREPQNGRNFEYFGEDPYLAGQIAAAYVGGVQSQSVAACIKHFVCNNQEIHRDDINAIVDERALREIYLPAFEAAIKQGHAAAVMAAYNLVNGEHMSANGPLLNGVLKTDWDFTGLVMSDWGATHDTLAAALGGLDLEMPSGKYFNAVKIWPLMQSGKISQAVIDDKVRRLLRLMVRFGWIDRPQKDPAISLDDEPSNSTALTVAQEGMVLLKNQGNLLPLDWSKIHSLVLVGPEAATYFHGGGSSEVKPIHSTTLADALWKMAPPGVSITQIAFPKLPTTRTTQPANAVQPPIFTDSECATIAAADAVIACVGPHEGEGHDRTYDLPDRQEELLEAVSVLNPRSIVVLSSGGNVGMSRWIDRIPALLDAWYGGQDGGLAVAQILFGQINPSGRLPDTFEKRWEDSPAYGNYPGDEHTVRYAEGIYVGYRWYDKKQIEPRFCFGSGLSYTTFSISNLKIAGRQVTVDVTNTGPRTGAEVVQLYVRPPSGGPDRAPQELKAFARVLLNPGETKSATMNLDDRSFSYWDVNSHAWKITPGTYEIAVGRSSRDICVTGKIDLK